MYATVPKSHTDIDSPERPDDRLLLLAVLLLLAHGVLVLSLDHLHVAGNLITFFTVQNSFQQCSK